MLLLLHTHTSVLLPPASEHTGFSLYLCVSPRSAARISPDFTALQASRLISFRCTRLDCFRSPESYLPDFLHRSASTARTVLRCKWSAVPCTTVRSLLIQTRLLALSISSIWLASVCSIYRSIITLLVCPCRQLSTNLTTSHTSIGGVRPRIDRSGLRRYG